MKIRILLCNCKGLCDSFRNANMNTLPFEIESDLEVQYTVLHPQLCGQGGNEILTEILRESAADPETYHCLWRLCSGSADETLQETASQYRFRCEAFHRGRYSGNRQPRHPGASARDGRGTRENTAVCVGLMPEIERARRANFSSSLWARETCGRNREETRNNNHAGSL